MPNSFSKKNIVGLLDGFGSQQDLIKDTINSGRVEGGVGLAPFSITSLRLRCGAF